MAPGVAPARPLPATVNEVRIAIPPGAKGVSLAWELVAMEGPDSFFNDGMDISVVDAAGFLIAHVVNADMAYSPEQRVDGAPTASAPGGTHAFRPGPQGASAALPPLPHPAYLSIACWNGGNDNSFPSSVHVDAIQFWGSDEFRLSITAPFGPGSIRLQNTGGDAGERLLDRRDARARELPPRLALRPRHPGRRALHAGGVRALRSRER